MASLRTHQVDWKKAEEQLGLFKALLDSKDILSESQDILPFFADHSDCAALLGTYHPDLVTVDKLAEECDVFGSFRADLVIADSQNSAYCFVEFENAKEDSIFSQRRRATTYWSNRFLGGYSQLVDWFERLDDESSTGRFSALFGGRQPRLVAMLIIGRDRHLRSEDRQRLEWWRQNVPIAKRHVYIRTFDELYVDLSRRLLAAKAQAAAFAQSAV